MNKINTLIFNLPFNNEYGGFVRKEITEDGVVCGVQQTNFVGKNPFEIMNRIKKLKNNLTKNTKKGE